MSWRARRGEVPLDPQKPAQLRSSCWKGSSSVAWGLVSEAGQLPENALSVLRVAVADAGGDPGVHVSRARIMKQTGITDLEEFVRVAEYLAERGYIAEGVNRYDLFVVTLRGISVGAGDEQYP